MDGVKTGLKPTKICTITLFNFQSEREVNCLKGYRREWSDTLLLIYRLSFCQQNTQKGMRNESNCFTQ